MIHKQQHAKLEEFKKNEWNSNRKCKTYGMVGRDTPSSVDLDSIYGSFSILTNLIL